MGWIKNNIDAAIIHYGSACLEWVARDSDGNIIDMRIKRMHACRTLDLTKAKAVRFGLLCPQDKSWRL